MLTEDERRRLHEIEYRLLASDPGLAESLRTFVAPGFPRWAARWALLSGWLIAFLLVMGGQWLVTLVLLPPLVALTGIFFLRRLGSGRPGGDV